MKFAYQILSNEKDSILIEDLSEQIGCMSITNSAEDVIEDIKKHGLLKGGKRIFYIDTMGVKDELLHDGEKFIGFAPGS